MQILSPKSSRLGMLSSVRAGQRDIGLHAGRRSTACCMSFARAPGSTAPADDVVVAVGNSDVTPPRARIALIQCFATALA
jgi:hypothetical protein